MKRIGIIGTGNVALALGRRFLDSGYVVSFGSRDKTDSAVCSRVGRLGGSVEIRQIGEVIEESPVIILAVPYAAALDIASTFPLAGKLVIDASNPLSSDYGSLTVDETTSGAQELQKRALGSEWIKLFNTVPYEAMSQPDYTGGKAFIPMAGDNAAAKVVAKQLGEAIGFEVIDIGPLSNARISETMSLLFIAMATNGGLGRDFAMGLLRR